jgi:hypothetical protein
MVAIVLKVGTIEGAVIVTEIVVSTAHCPGVGVNVKLKVPTVAVEILEGDQVPVIGVAFVELVGNAGAVVP